MSNVNDFQINDGVLVKYVGNEGNVVIPNGVTSIGNGAFRGCELLKNVTLEFGKIL